MLIVPIVGLKPQTPHRAAGTLTEPPVSVPKLTIGYLDMATETAEPPLEPPGIRVGSTGFRTGPKKELDEVAPIADSCRFVFPRGRHPLAKKESTTSELTAGTNFSKAREPAVVRCPATKMLSFIVKGTP